MNIVIVMMKESFMDKVVRRVGGSWRRKLSMHRVSDIFSFFWCIVEECACNELEWVDERGFLFDKRRSSLQSLVGEILRGWTIHFSRWDEIRFQTCKIWELNQILMRGSLALCQRERRRIFIAISHRIDWRRSCSGLVGEKTEVYSEIMVEKNWVKIEIFLSIFSGDEMLRRGKEVELRIFLNFSQSET